VIIVTGIMGVLLGGCASYEKTTTHHPDGTIVVKESGHKNYNDVMAEWVSGQTQARVAESKSAEKVAEYEKDTVTALVDADAGGMSLTTEDGQVISYTNLNPALYGSGRPVLGMVPTATPATKQKPVINLPQRRASWWERGLNYTAGILGEWTNPATILQGLNTWANYKTSENEAKYTFLGDQALYGAFTDITASAFSSNTDIALAGFESNTEVSTQALQSMQTTAESGFGQMQILGTNYANAMAESHGYGMAAIRDVTETAFENPLTNVYIETNTSEHSSSSSSVNTTTFPDFSDWPTITIGGDDDEGDTDPEP